jgi:tetratricopeptide (TPR) repeat protein
MNSPVRKSSSPLLAPGLLALVAVIVSVLFWTLWRRDDSSLSEFKADKTAPPIQTPFADKEDVLTLAMLSPESEYPRNVKPNFVGPQACAECHPQNYAGFQQTKHPFTCREVTAEKMPDGFGAQNNRLQSVFPEVSFEMTRVGEKFVQTSIETRQGITRRTHSNLDLVLGAGGVADDVFLSWKDDGHLWELPMAWLYPSQEWAASHFDPHAGGEFARAMTPRCVECHNTWVEHIPGTVNQFSREGAIFGVTCEVCHGPAGDHVEFHRANPDQLQVQRLVATTKLNRQRHIEVCTQCHSNAMRSKGPAFSYKPGNPLEDSFLTLPTKVNEDDRVANQITYLRRSRCFQADESMTCVTCHNPHQPNDASKSGSASCKNCHSQDPSCQSNDRLPVEVRDDCVACHMPSYLKINVNFQTAGDNYVPPLRRTNHQIAVHQQAVDERLLNHYRTRTDEASQEQVRQLTDRLVQHYEAEAASCHEQFRFLAVIAARREQVRIQDSPQAQEKLREAVKLHEGLEGKFSEAMKQIQDGFPKRGIELFEEILKTNPRDSKAHGRLGTEYAKAGDIVRGKQHLVMVAQLDPNDSYGFSMLGWIAYLEGKFDESLAFHQQAEELEPVEAKIKYQKALTLIRMGRSGEAIDSLKQALEIEPLHNDALPLLIQGLVQHGRPVEAVPYAERLARATILQNVRFVLLLAEVYRSAKLEDKAIKALRLAINLAEHQEPALLPQLHKSLQTLSAVPSR